MSEIDTRGRHIISASPQNATLIQIHTDSNMKLRIRLLERLPNAAPKLLSEMKIIKPEDNNQVYSDNLKQNEDIKCGYSMLSLENGTLTNAIIGNDGQHDGLYRQKVFLHQSRLFFIIRNDKGDPRVITDGGKFYTSLPSYFFEDTNFWFYGGFLSYGSKLLYVPRPNRIHRRFHPYLPVLLSEDFFRSYEVILYQLTEDEFNSLHKYEYYRDAITNYVIKTVSIFENEVLVINSQETWYYDQRSAKIRGSHETAAPGHGWQKFEMNWDGLPGILHGRLDIHNRHPELFGGLDSIYPMVRVKHVEFKLIPCNPVSSMSPLRQIRRLYQFDTQF